MEIGSTIRAIRKRKNITITQLCEGTGLSKGFMSHVENNKTSPSIATLQSIARFLHVPLSYLLLEKEQKMNIVRRDERKQISLKTESFSIEDLTALGAMDMKLIHLPPDGRIQNGLLTGGGPETHYIMQGGIYIEQGEEHAHLQEGDSFSWNGCVPRVIHNQDKKAAILLLCMYQELV